MLRCAARIRPRAVCSGRVRGASNVGGGGTGGGFGCLRGEVHHLSVAGRMLETVGGRG